MPDPIRVAVAGAAGRMGATVCEAVDAAEGLELTGRADPSLGVELGEVLDDADVVVDFTVPDHALPNAHKCLHAGVNVVIGTTGFDLEKLAKCATDHWDDGQGARAFVAPNFAIGAVLMMEIGQRVAEFMPEVEIVELHHDKKLDKPSGTAARTAELLGSAGAHVHEPIHSIRLPGLVAHQEIIFGGEGQTLSIRHDSIDRRSFMPGVVLACRRIGDLPNPLTVGLESLLVNRLLLPHPLGRKRTLSDDLARMDATAQAELVSSGEATPSELMDAAIARAEKVNPEINAIIHDLSDSGREQAGGEVPDGPFKGVPFLLKDLGAANAGEPLNMGMQLLKEANFVSPVDTTLAQRFRDAGLITFGKTNTPELGIVATTEPKAWGASRNPWDTTRSPGGSSGGSGAAVAAGIVPMAHANDGGGSIRIPASNNGLVGLKPTRQRISEGPMVGDNMSGVTVELCVSRSVRDTARLLDAVHGPAPGDPYVAPAPLRPYVEELNDESGGLHVGIMTRPAVEGLEVEAPCLEAVANAAKLIEGLGHEIDEGSFLDWMPDAEGGPDIEDSFITRWAAGQAATLAQLGMLLGREITADDVEPLTWEMAKIGEERTGGRYLMDVGIHQGMTRMIATWFASGYDLLLTPTMAEVAPPLGAIDTAAPGLEAFDRCLPSGAYTALFNITGQPAISIPLHWTEDGVPVGVQLVAPFGREDLCLRIAAQLERAAPWADRTPPVFAG